MCCLDPLTAYGYVNEYGYVDSQVSFKDNGGSKLYLPCRYCVGCAVQIRALKTLLFKMEMHTRPNTEGAFVTLTYNQDQLPPSGLCYSDLENFIRSFKRFVKKEGFTGKIDYVYSGEYGLLNFRPHFHICFLGINPLDYDYLFKRYCYAMNKYSASYTVNHIWKKGFNVVLPLNTQTMCYTLGYTVKKVLTVGNMKQEIQAGIKSRRKKAGFPGLMRVGTKRSFDEFVNNYETHYGTHVSSEKEAVRQYNERIRLLVPETIMYKGRKIDNPEFPKNRCFLKLTDEGYKYFACERTGASCSLGDLFYKKYKSEFLTGFIHDPVDPKKLCTIPPKFLKKLLESDEMVYHQIKRNKAIFSEMKSKMIDDMEQYYNANENALKIRLKGNNIRPLDLEMLSPEEEEEIEKLIT